MKILHLGNVPVPVDHPERKRVRQHPGRWVLNHALAQKAAGLDVEIVSQAHKASCDFDCEIGGVTVHYLRTYHPCRHFTFYALDAWRMARFARELKPDVVHAHGTEAAYGHAAIRCGIPFCVTAQGLFFKIIPALGRPPTWNERFLQWGEDMVWRRVRFAIAKSEYGVSALRSRYPGLDVTLIHNAYDISLERPVSEKSGHEIAFVGIPDHRKGSQFLPIIATRLVHDETFRFHFVGNSPEGSGSPIQRECVAKLRSILGSRLILHGKMDAAGVFSVLDRCRVIVAPSLEEMSGNQVTEGIMRGCHAVVFDNTGVAGIVRKVGNGTLVPYGNAIELADAVADALIKFPSAEEIQAARAGVSSLMSPAVVSEQHRQLYEKLLRQVLAEKESNQRWPL